MSIFAEWPEIEKALSHKRFELVLKNVVDDRSPNVNEEELQNEAFPEDSVLNLLYIGGCGLRVLHPSIAHCTNLTNLVLKDNALETLPEELGLLAKLKLIDVSSNQLKSLPASFSQLENLMSLDVSNNKIEDSGVFDMTSMPLLHILDFSHNNLSTFPSTLASPENVKLHTVNFSKNNITILPFEFGFLPQIKDFKMEGNQLAELPLALAKMEKLKFLDIKSNPFKDKRFRKLANDPRAKVPSIINYLKPKCAEKEEPQEEKGEEEEDGDHPRRLTVRIGVPNMSVRSLDSIRSVRPHLLVCVLRNIDLTGVNFRRFIAIQTKLHSGECANRTLAAIGTHDLALLAPPLRYLALPRDQLFITALHKKTPVSATDLLANLLLDAELARKREKKSSVSNVHRYLHLVKDLPELPCLIDSNGLVISLAPLSNSDLTKLSEGTRDVLVEVSSSDSLSACHRVLDALIAESAALFPSMEVDQMRVHSEADDLLGEYPARVSLPALRPNFINYTENIN